MFASLAKLLPKMDRLKRNAKRIKVIDAIKTNHVVKTKALFASINMYAHTVKHSKSQLPRRPILKIRMTVDGMVLNAAKIAIVANLDKWPCAATIAYANLR